MNHMSTTSSLHFPETGWGMLKKDTDAQTAQYVLAAPARCAGDQCTVLVDVLHSLLDGCHVVLRAESADSASLRVLRALGAADARVLKGGESSVLIAQLEQLPTAEQFQALPRGGARLRFAGFSSSVPTEQVFSSLMEQDCPAALTLDCTYVAGHPALSIRFDPAKLDECSIVEAVRAAVQRSGAALEIDFAS